MTKPDALTTLDMPEAAPIQTETAGIIQVIARVAADKSVDVDKLERLLAMQERLLADQRRTAYMAALARLQAVLPQIAKSGTITDRDGAVRNKYARMEDVDHVIRPLCAAEGFSFSFDSKPVGKDTEFSCKMSHSEGHSETKTLTLPTDSGPGRSAVQNMGSTVSYAKRYLLGMHLHLITRGEDDDGSGQGREPITAAQAAELKAALAEAGGSEARFLNWIAAESFEAIPVGNLSRARSFIAERRRQGAK